MKLGGWRILVGLLIKSIVKKYATAIEEENIIQPEDNWKYKSNKQNFFTRIFKRLKTVGLKYIRGDSDGLYCYFSFCYFLSLTTRPTVKKKYFT